MTVHEPEALFCLEQLLSGMGVVSAWAHVNFNTLGFTWELVAESVLV